MDNLLDLACANVDKPLSKTNAPSACSTGKSYAKDLRMTYRLL